MGLKNFIKFMNNDYPVDLLNHHIPQYQPWETKAEMDKELNRGARGQDRSRMVSAAPQGPLFVHIAPKERLVKIEDWMLAIRRHRSIIKAEKWKNSGANFYENLITTVIEYGRDMLVDCIVLVVDKGSHPRKRKTQLARAKAAQRTAELKRQKTQGGSSSSSAAVESSEDPAKEKKEGDDALPEGMEITDDGIQLPNGKTHAMDPTRIMSDANRGLRIKLYQYLLKKMVNDTRFYRQVNGRREYFRIIFDFDPVGPWRIQYNASSRRFEAEQMDGRFANGIAEADLACFWWGLHTKEHCFIHAGDTDYIAIALLNAYRFTPKSLLIQIRAHDRQEDPVCMEAMYAQYLLYSAGLSSTEFALGCIMSGTDYVDKSMYLNGVGQSSIWLGIRLYRILRRRLVKLRDRHDRGKLDSKTCQIRVREELERFLLGHDPSWNSDEADPPLMRTEEGLAEEAKAKPGEPTGPGAWIAQTVFHEYPHGLDAIVCCVYLVHLRSNKTRISRLEKNRELAGPVQIQSSVSLGLLTSRYLRPVLQAAFITRPPKAKTVSKEDPIDMFTEEPSHGSWDIVGESPLPKKSKKRKSATTTKSAVPKTHRSTRLVDLADPDFAESLDNVRFCLDYWATLEGRVPSLIWE